MIRAGRVLALSLLVVLLAPPACRDDVDPFLPDQRPVPGSTVRLTYSPGNERSPAWSADGDSVYYSAETFETQPGTPGVLLRVPRTSGSAAPLLPNVQGAGSVTEHWLLAPAPDPSGERLAYVEIVTTWTLHPCSTPFSGCNPPLSEVEARLPPPRRVAVRVRGVDVPNPTAEDTSVVMDAPGVRIDSEGIRTAIVNVYPYLRHFADDAAVGFRASWSPCSSRLVLSDGLRLRTWTVGADSAVTIPNTQDGVWPAWSPGCEWIAFTRLERADSTGATCLYTDEMGALICQQERTEYTVGRHALMRIRADGTGLLDLGDGDEPAWSPDGSALYFHREGRIWRSEPDGSNAVPVPDTEGGHEPAVSPDGRFLAFTRRGNAGTYDVWVTTLEP
ncbi:MAG: hypothetical protein GWN99_06070 [Gemmatimonadetes bacterium]|uniref:WD40 repeat protein n=1 Tax=Candidatus Kutchimonas denitrificans TaxID=3056748 RepID=A0AAE4ZA94_9BACT|nr:hypothetical protein [Gemmatimonadota bacterium]NIR76189.1 hypothetical protein [Candidatus Kutchimonas denitrificans]NIS00629.1 hypothetical protein [Gemmatimonadota bacterium]NIT66774.1 hypothetical protein [Gemmatimonadota bacterium]NIV23373.1 hypothetical protein [Gemmatimonadota bacterium]